MKEIAEERQKFGPAPAGRRKPMDRSAARRPFRHHNLQPAVGKRFAYEEIRQNAETEPGDQRWQNGVAVVYPQGADRAHHDSLSAGGRGLPDSSGPQRESATPGPGTARSRRSPEGTRCE